MKKLALLFVALSLALGAHAKPAKVVGTALKPVLTQTASQLFAGVRYDLYNVWVPENAANVVPVPSPTKADRPFVHLGWYRTTPMDQSTNQLSVFYANQKTTATSSFTLYLKVVYVYQNALLPAKTYEKLYFLNCQHLAGIFTISALNLPELDSATKNSLAKAGYKPKTTTYSIQDSYGKSGGTVYDILRRNLTKIY